MNTYFRTIGESDVSKREVKKAAQKDKGERVKAFWRRFLLLLGLYLDDLLMVLAGICFTASASLAFGLAAALAVAGVFLLVYSIVVARSRREGDGK